MSEAFLLHGVPVHVRFDRPPVEAVGVADGRVVAVGDLGAVRAAMPAGTAERRLDRGVVLPAFVDPHQHAFLPAVDPGSERLLDAARDLPGLLRLVGELAASGAAGPNEAGWRRLHGYETMRLAERRSPTARELDAVAGDAPLHVLTRTYHESAVSSAGLDALGIGRGTPDPAGGRIERDRRGHPTGVLVEAASFVAERASRPAAPDAAPDGGPAAWQRRLAAHAARLLALGITRIGDGAVPAGVAASFVRTLDAAGVTATPLLIEDAIDAPAIRAGAVAKVLLDGGETCHLCLTGGQLARLMRLSVRANLGPERDLARAVGNRSGWPRREADRRWHTGIRWPVEAGFPATLRAAADAGAGLAVHAVGNGAVDAILRGLASDPAAARAVPLRVEHAMAVDPAALAPLAAAGVPVVAQPGFLPSMGHALSIVPLPEPLVLLPVRSLLDRGIRVAFGSDSPAASLSPWAGIAAAVTRHDDTGTVLGAAEAVDLATALDASTRAAAAVLGGGATGTLEPGSPADLAWWDRDPAGVDPARLEAEMACLATWSTGRLVHEAQAAAGADTVRAKEPVSAPGATTAATR